MVRPLSTILLAVVLVLGGSATTAAHAASPLCASSGDDQTHEWVTRLQIDGKEVTSGKTGYADFTDTSLATVEPGGTYDVEVDVHTDDTEYLEYVYFWLDLDQDEAIHASDERVLTLSETFTTFTTFTGQLTIPADAFNGIMYGRMIMRFDDPPPLCGTYIYGTTYDYRLEVVNGADNPNQRPVTVDVVGGGAVTSDPPGIDTRDGATDARFNIGTAVTLTATPDAGQEFAGWSGADTSTDPSTTITLDSDPDGATITATFAPPASTDASLTGLTLHDVPLEPGFTPETLTYTATVGTDETVAITPIPGDTGATILLNGVAVGNNVSTIVDLAVGDNLLTIAVAAEDGTTTQTYTLTVTREASPPPPKPEPEPAPTPDPQPAPRPEPQPTRPGSTAGTLDGEPASFTIEHNNSGGATVSGQSFTLAVGPQHADEQGNPDGPTSGRWVSLERGRAAEVSMTGFAPGSSARVWLFSEPVLLGDFEIDMTGALTTATDLIDERVSACPHVLVAQGELADGRDIEASVGVWVQPTTAPFADVASSNLHAAAIACLADRQVANGATALDFAPNAALTRAQAASLLARLTALDTSGSSDLPDVQGTVHEGGITALVRAGIVHGFIDGRFQPDLAVTRGQFASMVARSLDLDPQSSPYPDTEGAHAGAIGALARLGIVAGHPDGTFRQGDNITRGQAASILVRAQASLTD